MAQTTKSVENQHHTIESESIIRGYVRIALPIAMRILAKQEQVSEQHSKDIQPTIKQAG